MAALLDDAAGAAALDADDDTAGAAGAAAEVDCGDAMVYFDKIKGESKMFNVRSESPGRAHVCSTAQTTAQFRLRGSVRGRQVMLSGMYYKVKKTE